ncbi:MAG: phytoene/squalene synthase family protein [Candidatus Thermoplasmatota archaeon]|nr:phytoene/squalene synthase family protein [Candidatus Thermoplasmatota archaeon]
MSNENLTPDESLALNGESFHWAKRFLGKKMGLEAAKLYAFCRLLDDMADGDIDNGPERLVNIRAALIEGNVDADPALQSFAPLMQDQDFPLPVLIALIDGLLDDQREEVIIADEAELLRYAYRVAGTVGLLMCHVLDCHDPDAKAHAIDLGIAMQLTNIARDVLEDAEMGRRYLPTTWTGDISPEQIVACANQPESGDAKIIKNSVERLLAMAERFYLSGAKGFSSLHWRAHMSIAIAAKVYRQIGVQLANRGYIWHEGRQVTTRTTKFICSFRAISGLAKRFSSRKHEHNSNLHTSLRGLPYVS